MSLRWEEGVERKRWYVLRGLRAKGRGIGGGFRGWDDGLRGADAGLV